MERKLKRSPDHLAAISGLRLRVWGWEVDKRWREGEGKERGKGGKGKGRGGKGRGGKRKGKRKRKGGEREKGGLHFFV